MENVVIYSKDDCVWCDKAKSLLTSKGYSFTELKYGKDFTRDELATKVGPNVRLTTPQIFFDDELIGGYNDLKSMLDTIDIAHSMQQSVK
jgi:glutaredoxin